MKIDHMHANKDQSRRKSSHLTEKARKSFVSRMFAGSDLQIEAPVKLNDLLPNDDLVNGRLS